MTQPEPAIVGYDLGDLLADIDRQIGAGIERTAQRYLPIARAKDVRKKVVAYIGEHVTHYDQAPRDHNNEQVV